MVFPRIGVPNGRMYVYLVMYICISCFGCASVYIARKMYRGGDILAVPVPPESSKAYPVCLRVPEVKHRGNRPKLSMHPPEGQQRRICLLHVDESGKLESLNPYIPKWTLGS